MPTALDNEPDQKNIADQQFQDLVDKTWSRKEQQRLRKAAAPAMSGEELESGEKEAKTPGVTKGEEAEQEQGDWFNDTGGRHGKVKTRFSKRKKLLAGGLVFLTGGGIGLFVIFSPTLRLESYMARINHRAFALAGSAVERRASHLFERYMISHALDLESCGNVITNACRNPITGGLAGGLFSTWRDVRIEQKLLDRFGLEIRSLNNPDRSAGAERFAIIDRYNGNRVVTLTNGDIQAGRFSGGSRTLGRDMRTFLRDETKWYELMHRRSVRKYLARKHNIRSWCFFACKTKDNIELRAADAKTWFKYRFVERFVFPFSGKYGFIMNCIISGGSCDGKDLRDRDLDRGRLPDVEIDEITEYFKSNPNAQLSQYVLEKLLAKVMSKQAARAAVSSIPIAGQVYFGLVVVDMFDRLDGYVKNDGLSKFAADLNARQYLEYYTGMRSVNDEMKSHVLSLEEVGAVMTEFEDAEHSLVYQSYANGNVYRNQGGDEPYLCNDGKPIPENEYVCREKKIKGRTFVIEDWRNNRAVDGIIETLNIYDCAVNIPFTDACPPGGSPRSYIRPFLDGIDRVVSGVLSPVFSAVFSLAESIPGVGQVLTFVKNKFGELMMAFFTNIFPLPVQLNSPGREKYDGLEAGADVAASEFGKGGYNKSNEPYGLGAPAITNEQSYAIMQDYFDQQQHDYENLGFMDKLTSLDYPQSFASKVVMSAPTQANQYPSLIASSVFSAFGSFGNLFMNQNAQAESQLSINAFGVTRYGYPLEHPAITTDPADLTEEYCEQAKQEWEASMTEDKLTGFDEYSVANPCLLELTAIETAGAWFVK